MRRDAGAEWRRKVKTETAILAGGCYWGMQEVLRHRPGVLSTRVGYIGGNIENPIGFNIGSHAESVEVVFDPEATSFRELLEFFFQVHDPSTRNRQGGDVGVNVRSGIFYTSPEQKQIAEETIAEVDASGRWPGKVTTEVTEATRFWPAEDEHQDYLQRNPYGYQCQYIRPEWTLPAPAEDAAA
jgi:peptide-methionine (S)-S-oxide reductase